MNKKPTIVTDKSAPYRTIGFNKITAPTKVANPPKARVIRASSDLRVKGGK